MEEIRRRLFAMQDKGYKAFQERLMPTVEAKTVIGVRTPQLRSFAKEVGKGKLGEEAAGAFLDELPHVYYEENNLHAFLIEEIGDYKECVERLEAFLPYVDNWATCDMMRPKCFGKHKEELLDQIEKWIGSEHLYTIRFGIEMLMVYFLEENFKTEYADMVAGIRSEEYYVNMMIAWYFATALAKQYEQIIPYLEKKKLDAWVHRKSIQKAIESFRISKEQKEYLRTLRD